MRLILSVILNLVKSAAILGIFFFWYLIWNFTETHDSTTFVIFSSLMIIALVAKHIALKVHPDAVSTQSLMRDSSCTRTQHEQYDDDSLITAELDPTSRSAMIWGGDSSSNMNDDLHSHIGQDDFKGV